MWKKIQILAVKQFPEGSHVSDREAASQAGNFLPPSACATDESP